MELTRLRTSHMENPLGIDTIPYFSWIILSGEQCVLQTAYRLIVSTDGGVVWDSGKTEGEQSTFIVYEGSGLKSRTRYSWTVTVWDNKGNEADASAWFETALLSTDEWKTAWAVSPFPYEEREVNWGNQPPATMFRKEFILKGGIIKARLYATSHGVYRLTINGSRADDREFAPEFTAYDKYLCYQTYDVTGLLQPGANVIGLYVGDGWYCGPMTVRGKADDEDPPHAVLFQLELQYSNGGGDIISSDESVKAAQGPVLFSDLFAGENYDANREAEGWDTAGFSDDGWDEARIVADGEYGGDNGGDYGFENLVAQIGPAVRPVALLPAVRVYTSPKGERIVDFGQNLAGRVRMKVNAPKGETVTLDHFEAPDRDSNYFSNIHVTFIEALCEQRVCYISDGKPREFEPLFTFHGFRYVRVTGVADVRAEDFTAVALSSDNENTGTFECSDVRLNRLYENTCWSQRSNMLSIPTDCPQREKAGWTGDAHVYAETAFLNQDMTCFFTRWLRSLACEQAEDGRIPLVVPYPKQYMMAEMANLMAHKEPGMPDSAGYSDAAVIVPYAMYQTTGNALILREQYASMKLWCDYVIRKSAKRGNADMPEEIERYLWNTGYHYGEWMIPSLFKSGYGKENHNKVTATALYTAPIFGWYSLSLTAKTAELLGFGEDAAYYGGMADKIKNAFAAGIIDKDGNMPFELQGAYVLPLFFDLVPDEHREHFTDKLISMIRENGDRLDTGFLATPFLLDTLCKIGRVDVAYMLLYQENGPSWLDQLNRGATTIWESWYCYGEDGNPLPMSMNHYALGCVDDWLFRYIAGIERALPGFKHIKIHPRPDASLVFAKRTFISEYGEIVCRWERADGVFHLYTEIPCNTAATIIMPDGEIFETGSGCYKFQCSDAQCRDS